MVMGQKVWKHERGHESHLLMIMDPRDRKSKTWEGTTVTSTPGHMTESLKTWGLLCDFPVVMIEAENKILGLVNESHLANSVADWTEEPVSGWEYGDQHGLHFPQQSHEIKEKGWATPSRKDSLSGKHLCASQWDRHRALRHWGNELRVGEWQVIYLGEWQFQFYLG